MAESYAGKKREKVTERLMMEFEGELTKTSVDELERFCEWKRWMRQKEKALLREWAQKRQELKDRTVKLIEDQIEETTVKLKQDYDQSKFNRQL